MVGRYAYILTLAALLVTALAIPQSRKVMGLQAQCVRYGLMYPGLSLDNGRWPDAFVDRWANSAGSGMPEWQRDLALMQLRLEPMTISNGEMPATIMTVWSTYLADQAVAAAPDKPEALAGAVTAFSMRARYTRPEEMSPSPNQRIQSRLLDRALGQTIVRIAREGSRLDPENSFFDLMAADALFGVHRDAEALAMIHSAAAKPHFDEYSTGLALTKMEFLRSAGIPDVEALAGSDPSFARMAGIRQAARLAKWHGYDLLSCGNSSGAKRIASDLLAIGEAMQSNATSATVALNGYAVASIGVSVDPMTREEKRRMEPMQSLARMRYYTDVMEKRLRSQGWDDLMERWRRQSEEQYRLRSDFPRHGIPGASEAGTVLTASTSSQLSLRLAALFFGMAVLMWLLAKVGRWDQMTPAVSVPGRVSMAIATILPWLALTAVWGMTSHGIQMLMAAGFSGWPAQAQTWEGAIASGCILVAFWGTASVLLIRHLPRRGEPWRGALSVAAQASVLPATVTAITTIYLAVWRWIPTGPSGSTDAVPNRVGVALGMVDVLTILAILVGVVATVVRLLVKRDDKSHAARAVILVTTLILSGVLLFEFGRVHPVSIEVLPGTALLWVIFMAFVCGRSLLVQRGDGSGSITAIVLSTVRSYSMTLGKALVLVYFVLLLGQLPFRYSAARTLDRWTRNEVRMIRTLAEQQR